jgi:hypothetical protein
LNAVINLYLQGADFASDLVGSSETSPVYTAYNTFNGTILSSLSSLSLSDAIFAVANMTQGDVKTAVSTFSYADLSGLKSLDLSATIFAASGMTTSSTFNTANYTFSYTNLSGMTSLDLGDLYAVGNNTGANGLNANTFNDIIQNTS